MPALIGRAEDFEVDPDSNRKQLRSFQQEQKVIGFPWSMLWIEEEQEWIGNQAGGWQAGQGRAQIAHREPRTDRECD